jgi:Flp pilus assembly protein TadD
LSRGDTAEGASQLQLASGLKPSWRELHVLLGTTLAKQSRLDEAVGHLRQALRIDPRDAGIHCQLAGILDTQHQVAEAIAHYTEALRLEPDMIEALNNLAWIRAAHSQADFRDGAEAVRLAEQACRVTGDKEPMLIGTLAAAYAEAGRFEEAVTAARKARELALAGGQKELAEKNQKLIELYSARQPYREPAQP